jgi:hypothetical protein
MKLIPSVATLALLLCLPADQALTQSRPAQRLPIIDVHVHAYAKDERWTLKTPNPRTGIPLTATSEPTRRSAKRTADPTISQTGICQRHHHQILGTGTRCAGGIRSRCDFRPSILGAPTRINSLTRHCSHFFTRFRDCDVAMN